MLVHLAGAGGRDTPVRGFQPARSAVELGFEQPRISGSHHIFGYRTFPEILNLQQVRAQAKPY